jgi:hypothetical protein
MNSIKRRNKYYKQNDYITLAQLKHEKENKTFNKPQKQIYFHGVS